MSLEIRTGRISRDEAIKILQQKGDETPWEQISSFCKWVDISEDNFFKDIEKFRSMDVWKKDGKKWIIKDYLLQEWLF